MVTLLFSNFFRLLYWIILLKLTRHFTEYAAFLVKVHLTPNFFYLFSKRMHDLMKITKQLCESIKSPRIYGGLKFGFSGSRPRVRRSGTQGRCDVSGGNQILSFRADGETNLQFVKFLASKRTTQTRSIGFPSRRHNLTRAQFPLGLGGEPKWREFCEV